MAKTATKQEPSAESRGLAVDQTHVRPEQQAAQKAAILEYQRRLDPSSWVTLGNGVAVKVTGQIGMLYPGENASKMLGDPRGMLLAPKPDFIDARDGRKIGDRYQWRIRTSSDPRDSRPALTRQLKTSDRIRYVEVDEIDPHCNYAVYTEHAVGENRYVTYVSLILCEILDPNLAYETYKGWEDYGIGRASNLEDLLRSEKNTRVSGKTEVSLSVSDQRAGG